MPQATMQHEDAYPVPAGLPVPAKLQAVTVRTIKYNPKDDYGNKDMSREESFDKWQWEFKITDGQYAGIKVYGETEDKLTNRDDNVVRQWAETLRGKPFEIGEGLNTDHLIGLPCILTVRHDDPRPKRDGGMFYPCPVDEVFPSSDNPDYNPF